MSWKRNKIVVLALVPDEVPSSILFSTALCNDFTDENNSHTYILYVLSSTGIVVD
jgi:hypothetical protein